MTIVAAKLYWDLTKLTLPLIEFKSLFLSIYHTKSFFFLVLNFCNCLIQGVFLHCWGVPAGWFSEECLPHKVQDCFQWRTRLPDVEKRSFCCRGSIYFLHCHSLRVLLCLLLQGQGKLPAIWRRYWCGYGNLQMILVKVIWPCCRCYFLDSLHWLLHSPFWVAFHVLKVPFSRW